MECRNMEESNCVQIEQSTEARAGGSDCWSILKELIYQGPACRTPKMQPLTCS